MKNVAKIMFSLLLIAVAFNMSAQNNDHLKNNTMKNFKSGKNEVKFRSQGVQLAGLIFTPEDFDESKSYPAVVFSGPFNQVKEQMGTKYGEKFAERGYVFLVFDHLGYGDSEGKVRNNENAFIKMESIRDAISYLRTLPFVNKEKFYGYGACASGGYMPLVAVTDKRLKAVATVSGMMDNQMSYFGAMTKEQLMPLFARANEARQKQYENGEVEYYDAMNMAAVDPNNVPEGAFGEGYDYYMTKRAGQETYPNYSHLAPKTLLEVAPMTSAKLYAPYLYTPYLGIYGEKAMADTAPLTTMFYEAASEPKELYEVPEASHVSLYDIDEHVAKAVAKMDEFFKKY